MLIRSMFALLLVTAAACGDDGGAGVDGGGDDDDDDDDVVTDGGGGGGDDDDDDDDDDPGYRVDLVGGINLYEYPEGDNGAIYAYLRDRTPPPVEVVVARAGDCALYEHEAQGECDPACEAGFCDADGECEPWSEQRTSGDILIDGLVEDITLVDGEFGYTVDPYPTGDIFADDAVVTATSEGGEVDAFTITTGGVAPLDAEAYEWALVDDEDFEVTWVPSDDPDARMQIALRVGWHGSPYEVMLHCETADDGSMPIPGELIAQLPPFGGPSLFQHPSDMTRFQRAVIETSGGPFELLVGSMRWVGWSHDP